MDYKENTAITVQTSIAAPVEKVWECWTVPEHIINWNNASDDWHTTRAENDLRVGGKFLSRMEAKDGSMGFDFEGVYEKVNTNETIVYVLGDGRKVRIDFSENGNGTQIIETFDTENVHSEEQQRTGWQNILENFKRYTEANIK